MVMLGVVLLIRIYETGTGGVTPIGAGAGLLSALSYAVPYHAGHGLHCGNGRTGDRIVIRRRGLK